jgi:glycosyltransferase involved in cell wall biosynthesis
MNNKKYHKKTILQVVPALVSGGIERGALEIAKKLVEAGFCSIVISGGGSLVKVLEESGSKHIKLNVASKNPITIWLNSKKISKIIREEKVDIIHARSRAPAWSCFIAAKTTGIKLITTFHGVYNFRTKIKKFYNSIMTEGHKVIAVSQFVKDHIIKNYKIDQDKIVLIHRGVDHKEFTMEKITPEILLKYKAKYNVPDNTPVILLPARMTEWKGHIILVKALEKIKHLNFYCIMAGDLAKHPAYVIRIKNLINECKIQNRVQLFGNEPNMINLYGISDIVLSSSIEPEAFGRTIIEAQSMEKLVIATKIGGAAETIEDNKTGFHVNPANSSQLADKIEYCLSIIGTDKAKEIKFVARKSTVTNFSLDSMLEKEMSVYKLVSGS